ncbi:MAG: hypothetical protein JWM76_1674 [Pseudonocardiales bacterium]|nr:hypothetical protein [Pseudonocardiales bacterium]
MFSPAKCTESEVLVGYLDQQLEAIRAAAYGLTEQQARATRVGARSRSAV